MALLIADSFDTYDNNSQTIFISAGPWSGSANGPYPSNTFTRFGAGRSMYMGNSMSITKNIAPSSNTVFAAYAYYDSGNLDGSTNDHHTIVFNAGGGNNCSVNFKSNGSIMCYRNGTLIATFAAAFTAQTWHHWQIKVVFSTTVGEIRIRKNGDTADTFVATGLNTQNTAFAYTDSISLSGSSASAYIDDVLIVDSSGAAGFNNWPGDCRCYSLVANAAGSAADFTNTGAVVPVYNPVTQSAMGSNVFTTTSFICPASGPMAKVQIPCYAAGTGNAVVGIYSDNNGLPGTLISQSSVLVNTINGLNDFTFASPPTLTVGVRYWMAFLANYTISFYQTSGNPNASYTTTSFTYTATLPTLAVYGGGGGLGFVFNIGYSAASNFIQTSNIYQDGDNSYNSSLTVGNHDLFAMQDLPVTPASIVGVVQRVLAKKTDAGTRSLQTEVKSGVTTVQGTSTALSTSYYPIITAWGVDPNTSTAWTAAAVNALECGYKLSA